MKNYLESTTQNIAWFKRINDDGFLEIRPSFQRNPVWTDKQKTYLIDSILRGYPIPEIYLQEKISVDGKSLFTVVDGQQRIRAVLDFISGKYVLEESDTDAKWANMSFDDLSETDKKNFYSYKFVIRHLPDIDDEEIRGIFKRINKNNIALNSQELRQSTYSGSFINIINTISDKEYWEEIGLFSPQKIRRMLDAEYISEIAIAYFNGHQNKKKKLDDYYVLYEQEFNDSSVLEDTFDTVCKEILQVLPNIKKTRWGHMVDFYTLFLVLAKHKDKLPFSSDERIQVNQMLIDFESKVNLYQKGELGAEEITDNIKTYESGIRNSSDLACRKNRFNALESQLEGILSQQIL